MRKCTDCDSPARICPSCAAIGQRDIAEHLLYEIENGATLDEIRAYAKRLAARAAIEIGEHQKPLSERVVNLASYRRVQGAS